MRKVHLLLLRSVVAGPEVEESWPPDFRKRLSRGWSVRTLAEYLDRKWAEYDGQFTPDIVHRALQNLIDANLLTYRPPVPPVTFRPEYGLDHPAVLEKVRASMIPLISDPNRREHAVVVLIKIMPREDLERIIVRDLRLNTKDLRCLLDG